MIKITNVYWMMAYALNYFDESDIKKVKSEKFDNVYDLLCVLLSNGINKQIKRGLHKEYIPTTESLSSLKGKIEINESIRKNVVHSRKMICTYDEYSINSYLNQIIKSAAVYLIKSDKIRDSDRKDELKKTLMYLNGVDTLERSLINWNNIRFNRNNYTYKFLINISYLIFNGLLMNDEDGNLEFVDVINDDMLHMLYEKFILEYFRIEYKNEIETSSPNVDWNVRNDIGVDLLPKMMTDIVIERNNKKLIIDAKYYTRSMQQRFDKETFRSNNLYQIYTYVKNEDKNNTGNVLGMLLYAKTDKEDLGWNAYMMGNNEIVITNLDLSKDFSFVEEQFEKIINYLKKRADN